MPKGIYKKTAEHKRKLSEANKGKVSGNKNKHRSEESKKKQSMIMKGRISWNKGKHLSEKHKRKLSEVGKGKTGQKSSGWRGGKTKTICKICGKEIFLFPSSIKQGRGEFCSRKCKGIWNIKHMNMKDTSIELAIEQELVKRYIPYLKQAPIEGIALVDFLLSNKIIIQCDGDYWHSRELNKGRDIAQDTVLFFKGYKVYRFTETEIKKSPKKCIDKIIGRK